MATRRGGGIGWKKEVAALALGLLLGSAWEAAQAGVRLPWTPARTSAAAPARRT